MGDVTKNKEKIAVYRERAKELVSKMTLAQKCFQTLAEAPAIEELGIKSYHWWNEALHGVARAGVATVFPQAITLAGCFDEDLVEQVADAISTEGRAKYNNQQKYNDRSIYKGLTFWSPNINIFRDPRWGRGHETYGEDPYLTSRLGVRFVEGIQGHDENYMKAAACAKHFVVHSGPENLRHSFNAEVSETDLRETYFPAFKACVEEAKVEAVMGAYNRTNGDPCCGSHRLLQEILRGEWGFDGHVVSDCGAIGDFHGGHKATETPVESAAMAMNNGCDLNCGNMFVYLVEAVKSGLVPEERIDEAVVTLFTTRMKLGIMGDVQDNPFDQISFDTVDSYEMQDFNAMVARKSMVLLKNQDGFLPLKKEKLHTIGVIGPNANSRKALVGNYEGTASRYETVLQGIQDYVGRDVRVLYSEGCHLYIGQPGCESDRMAEVKGICENSDVIICCLGLDASFEGEEGDANNPYAGGDKGDLSLPGLQPRLLEMALDSGKPVVLVLLAGSALAVNEAQERAAAVLFAGYPGGQGGKAIAELLFGEASPEGKLPITFYRTTEELPEFTDYSMKNRTYRYMKQKALYPFGYGLSYSSFEIQDVSLSDDKITDKGIDVELTIRNTGEYAAGEAVQIYVKVEDEDTPNAQLKGLKKVWLEKGEEKQVSLHLPVEAFGLFDESGKMKIRKGECTVYVGTQQPDERSTELTGLKPVAVKVSAESDWYLA